MIKIFPLSHSNIARVAEIENECFKSEAWSKALLEGEIGQPDKHYVVAYVDGVVAGFGGYAQILDEGHIINIAVASEFRRRGVGTAILQGLLHDGKTRGMQSFTLEARVSNIAARLLYEGTGFTLAGIRPKYYPDKEDACIYWLYM